MRITLDVPQIQSDQRHEFVHHFATRALVQSQAAELREEGVHVALLIVDAIIDSEKTKHMLEDAPPEKSASMEDVARAIKYLHEQSPRAWTHELQLTPALERWVP